MVYLNGLKYACEACIRGHRSSSCSHTDRALFEVQKKGRPVTQCEHCRQLRKTKQVHVKCSCEGGADHERKGSRGKAKRKVPSSAAFPAGLSGQSSSPSPVPQQKPEASHCKCQLTGHCACTTPISKKPKRASPDATSVSTISFSTPPISSRRKEEKQPIHSPQQQVQLTSDPDPFSGDLFYGLANTTSQPAASTSYSASSPYTSPATTLSTTSTWPSTIGVGNCNCGVLCICPGCYEHGDPSTALMLSENCPHTCATCSDCYGFGFAAGPEPNSSSPWAGSSSGANGSQLLGIWPATVPPNSFPSLIPTIAPLQAVTGSPTSDCCGGSCKCSAQAISCQCAAECCGCCFGCSCSDDSDSLAPDSVHERLGFAVSGERGSCCTDSRTCEDMDGSARKKKAKATDKHKNSEAHLYPSAAKTPDTQF